MRRKAANGTVYTDEQIEQWALAQESESEYQGAHLAPAMPGRPVSIGKNALPFTIRLDEERRKKVAAIAQERNVTPSELMRDLIDAI